MQKKIRKICKNCKYYNAEEGVCGITVIHGGEYYELPVKPNDHCHWLKIRHELSMIDGKETDLPFFEVNVKYDLENKKIKVEAPIEENPLNS